MVTITEQLVLAAQQGDDAALQQLISRYFPRVSRIVRARVGPRLRAHVEVDDVLQETFLQAVLRLADFEMHSDGAFLDWLATIGCNQVRKAAEHWSREKRDPAREIALDQGPPDSISRRVRDVSARISGPITRALHAERDALLEEALDELEEPQREALVLRNLVGLSFAEVAQRTGRPSEAAARELHRRARAKLALALRRKGYVADAVSSLSARGSPSESTGPR